MMKQLLIEDALKCEDGHFIEQITATDKEDGRKCVDRRGCDEVINPISGANKTTAARQKKKTM